MTAATLDGVRGGRRNTFASFTYQKKNTTKEKMKRDSSILPDFGLVCKERVAQLRIRRREMDKEIWTTQRTARCTRCHPRARRAARHKTIT